VELLSMFSGNFDVTDQRRNTKFCIRQIL